MTASGWSTDFQVARDQHGGLLFPPLIVNLAAPSLSSRNCRSCLCIQTSLCAPRQHLGNTRVSIAGLSSGDQQATEGSRSREECHYIAHLPSSHQRYIRYGRCNYIEPIQYRPFKWCPNNQRVIPQVSDPNGCTVTTHKASSCPPSARPRRKSQYRPAQCLYLRRPEILDQCIMIPVGLPALRRSQRSTHRSNAETHLVDPARPPASYARNLSPSSARRRSLFIRRWPAAPPT
ncbi:hypothetical protein BD626DRAFT_117490 [Schizophyllum amplum]|uniref:Uncharacterized protein n=1 Tax=Schizophyllum amplum TaxID=97359 RepID=A0A550CUQ5_9AGAR|nr:hypothetical protein BD626DRAFT_117490 [Auriculariopsis ampla]